MEGRPGDSAFIPRGGVHRFENLYFTRAKALAILPPGLPAQLLMPIRD
jgi:hypothetical protein